MKHCSNKKCSNKNPQSIDLFSKDSRNKDGLQSQCKTCKYIANKKWDNANVDKIATYEKSPERRQRHKETTYAWREKNKDKYNEYMRTKNKEAYPEARFKRYGVTKEWYEETLKKQNNRCAICEKENTSKKRCLVVDHHHSTNKVRGILCYNCNRALHAFDDSNLFNKIMLYLKTYA